MNTSLYYAGLITRYLQNNLTEKEHQELQVWMASDKANRELFEEIINENNQADAIHFLNQLSVEDGWNSVNKKIKHQDNRNKHPAGRSNAVNKKIAWAAAASFIIIVLGFFFWNKLNWEPTIMSNLNTPAEILPGGNRATLTLANGSVIPLDTLADGTIADQGNVQVIKLNGQLQYQSAGTENVSAYNTIQTPKGGKYKIILADGTTVWLNASSSLKFPVAFIGNERKVELTGEGFFDVTKDAKKPFRVLLENGEKIEVLGTSFNVNAYQDETHLRTTLLEGKITFTKNSISKTIYPGQQISVSSNNINAIDVLDNIDTDEVTAWKNDLFIFSSNDIKSIMRQISRWYDVEIVYSGEMKNDKFSGIVSSKTNLSQVLKIMEEGGMKFKIEGKKITVY